MTSAAAGGRGPKKTPKKKRTSGFVSARTEASKPKRIGTLVNQLIARKGYASVIGDEAMLASVRGCLDQRLHDAVRLGPLRAGVLQVIVVDSVTLQELNFQKRKVLRKIQADHPDRVTDLRFRLG